MNQPNRHAALVASYRRLEADARQKLAMAAVTASMVANEANACNEIAGNAKRQLDEIQPSLLEIVYF